MTSLLPLDTLAGTIKAHIAAGDRALDKAEQHYRAAGIHLLEAKERVARTEGLTWAAFLKSQCGIQRSRADELIAIAQGRTTLAEVREATRLRVAAYRPREAESPLRTGHPGTRSCGTGTVEWYTPEKYTEKARRVLGGIDLDPASCHFAQKTVRASAFFTKEDDGLAQTWRGRIWLNPPYARALIGRFVDKLLAEVGNGNVESAILLTHSHTDTTWFHRLARSAEAVCFSRGKISFVSPTRSKPLTWMEGQCFYYFGDDPDRFADEFGDVGQIMQVRPACTAIRLLADNSNEPQHAVAA